MLTVLYKWWSRSIRWKLVGVFVIISVIPMLIATKFATQVVSTTFEDNVEAWLFQTSHFFVANILDQRRETASIADVLAENGSLTALVTGQSREMPPAVSHMINALGYDLNTVEFAVEGGVPYAIDFMNPAPDADVHSVGEANFAWIVDAMAALAVRKALEPPRRATSYRWDALLNSRNP